MELTKMNDRAWMWVALDFADEEVRLEKLCVRFKTADEAANFKDAFARAKVIVVANETSSVKNTVSVSTPPLTHQTSKVTTKVVTSPVTSSVPDTSSSNKKIGRAHV
jgi:E3 SUMO-protein ligase RanBP2